MDNASIFLHFSHARRIINWSTRKCRPNDFSLSLSLSRKEALRVIRLRQFSRESDQRRNQKKDELSPTSGKCRIGYVERFDRKRRVFFFFFLTGNFSNFPKFGPHGQIIAQVSEILQTLSSPPIETLFIPLVTISYRESFKRGAFRTAKRRYFVPPVN